MQAKTLCIQCRTELLLLDPEPGRAVVCPTCGMTWSPDPHDITPVSGGPPPRAAAQPRPAGRSQSRPKPVARDPLPIEEDDETPPRTGTNPLMYVGLAGFLLVLLVGGGVGAWFVFGSKPAEVVQDDPPTEKPTENPPTAPTGTKLSGEQVYQQLLKSSVLVFARSRGGELTIGSGVVVHAEKKLVVTNFHVIRNAPADGGVLVVFPAYDDKKKVITSPAHYADNLDQLGITGRVALQRGKKDLAVVELDRLPTGVAPIPFAVTPAPTGSEVFSIGASAVDRNMFWKLASGRVTGRSEQKLDAPWGVVTATVLETNAGVNPGDSGGPVVNDRGELVAVVSHFDKRQRSVSGNIDAEEVNTMLTDFATKAGWEWKPTPGGPPPEDPDSPEKLIARLADPVPEKRLEAAQKLAALGAGTQPAFAALFKLLDDPDVRVRGAAADALEKVGAPGAADVDLLDRALSTAGPRGKLYALKFFSKEAMTKVPEGSIPVVVRLLGDPSAEVRKIALRVLANYGPGSKAKAFAAVFERVADDDKAVADEAIQLLAAYTPFDDADRKVLVDKLTSPKPVLKRLAVDLLGSAAPDAATAIGWFRPRFDDPDHVVRAKAIENMHRWGPAGRACLPEFVARMSDGNPAVAVAAIKAVVAVGGGVDVVPALTAIIKNDGAPADVREAAIEALLKFELTDAEADVPTLEMLSRNKKPTTRAAALLKLGNFGKAAKNAIPSITELLKDPDPAVRVAALRALALIGPDAASAIPAVARLVADTEPEAVVLAAIDALARLGPKAIEPLYRALDAKLSSAALVRLCDALGGYGKAAQAAVPTLLGMVSRQTPLAGMAAEQLVAVQGGKAWVMDPVAAALARIGGDALAKQMSDWCEFKSELRGGEKVKVPAKGAGVQLWAMLVLGQIDPGTLTDAGKKIAAEKLAYLAVWDPDPICKSVAKAGSAKHPLVKK